ncbi:pilus assembly PilX family protein [Thiobaca trueperi]|uniref:Type IV pilus assembly protein PilX n=1 Tax=Thiobaca trueperi TaxID=127458 RepID=A0A4R3N7L7_9GAMM|nr:pilus assembly protein [Thiobaca trueperi]TCT22889.1 type IV pilus assembly protein PilX [Thiobaca trueperi]
MMQQSLRHRQHGTVLVIGLILLLLMTLIGVTAIQTTSLDERMAGNARDRNLAFQAAEAALREAEQNVTKTSTPDLLPKLTEVKPDPQQDTAWDNYQTYTGTIQDIINKPTYVIEKLADLSSALEFKDVSGLYRVTSRGQGSTATAVVVLQTTIGRGNPD